MSESAPAAGKNVRFNLFAFAPEPSGRFFLFAAASLMLAVHLGLFVRYALTPEADLASPFLEASAAFENLSGEALFRTFHEEFWRVSNGTFQSLGFPALFALILVIAGAAASLWHGLGLARAKRSERFLWQRDASFFEAVEKLAEDAGAPPHELWMGRGARFQGVKAFSRGRKPALFFDAGLRVLFRRKPEIFKAAVLHELSHRPNHSLTLAYGVHAVWKSVCSWIVYPLGLSTALILARNAPMFTGSGSVMPDGSHFFQSVFPTLLLFLFQTLGAMTVLGVLRSGYFRARALWADARASSAGGGEGLAELLEKGKLPWSKERLQALKDPAFLFRIVYDLPFWAGLLCAFASGAVMLLLMPVMLGVSTALLNFGASLAQLAQNSQDDLMAILMILTVSLLFVAQVLLALLLVVMPLLGTGYLIARTVGRQIQRASAAEMAAGIKTRDAYGKLWPYAVLIAIGIEAGFFFTPYALHFPRTLKAALFMIPWFAAVTELTWLCLGAARFLTRKLIGRHTGSEAPRRKSAYITAVVSFLAGGVYVPMFVSRALILTHAGHLNSVEVLFFLCSAIVISLGVFAAVFFSAWLLLPVKFSWKQVLCPACGQSVRQKGPLLNQSCAQCGCPLTPWVLLGGDRLKTCENPLPQTL